MKIVSKLFLIPFLFTFGNALCGFLSVIHTLDEDYRTAALFIIFAALMDLCDGRLARMIGSTSVLGMELDSLCDAISFCFAPAILLYSWSLYQLGMAGMIVLGLFLCTGLFRLARFNIISVDQAKYFVGLPTTIAAFFIANIVIYEQWINNSIFKVFLKVDRLAFLIAIIALLMISTIKFPSVKSIKMRFSIGTLLLLGAVSVTWFMIKGYPIFMVAVAFYIIASFIVSIFKEITRSWWK